MGDEPSTKAQWGVVIGLLKGALTGDDQKVDDFYRAFLDWLFATRSTKELLKREAATLINWLMWNEQTEEFDTYRQDKPFMSDTARTEFLSAVRDALKMSNDQRYLEL